jgi:hypothetical protein
MGVKPTKGEYTVEPEPALQTAQDGAQPTELRCTLVSPVSC